MKDVGKFCGYLVYFTAISHILGPFGISCGHFGIFFEFWYVVHTKKNLAKLVWSSRNRSTVDGKKGFIFFPP
jgi:hypothetical protein